MKFFGLVVLIFDGENGNVMMFEYFKNFFVFLFWECYCWLDVGFMIVSEYIDIYLLLGEIIEVRLKLIGGLWIGGY